jgi:alpha-tubulin suppressor-like RCC1 family protein
VLRALALAASGLLLFACSGGGGSNSAKSVSSSVDPSTLLPMPTAQPGAIAGGNRFALVVRDGKVMGTGNNQSGELGDGTTTSRATLVPAVGIDRPVVAIAAGSSHSVALTDDGSVWTWGHNGSGELGNGTTKDSPVPQKVTKVQDVRGIAAGDGFTLVLLADGSVYAWGNNKSGQLGDGNAPQDSSTPSPVHGLGSGSGVIEVLAGSSFGIVRKADGSILEWGNGTSGQLGDGTTGKQSAPSPVAGFGPGSGVVAVAGGTAHVLALKSDGSLWAWGHDASGQLGDGGDLDQTKPVPVQGLGPGSGVVRVAAGESFSLALKSDGSVLAWGHNASGQLGNGAPLPGPPPGNGNPPPPDSKTPIGVTNLGAGSGIVLIAAGDAHALAMTNVAIVMSWGNNSLGQLGDGNPPNDNSTPAAMVGADGKPQAGP